MEEKSYLKIGSLRIHRAWIMLVACCFLATGYLGMLFGPNGNFYVAIAADTGFARSQLSVWQQVHFLTMAATMPLWGWLYDRVNIRVLLSVSCLGVILGAFLMGTYTEAWQWSISGLLHGAIGGGLMYMPQAILIGNWFQKRRGVALGISTAAASLAITGISPLFVSIIEAIGWRSAYTVQAIMIAILILPWTLFVIHLRPSDIGALPYGYEPEAEAEADAKKQALLLTGVPFRRALLSIPFLMLFIFAGVATLIGSGFDAHIPGFAVSMGYSPMFGALMVSALYAGSCIEKLVMGWVNDKIGVQRTVFIELLIVAVGMVMLVVCKSEWALLVASFLFGVQDSFASVSLPLLIRAFFGAKDYSRLFAWANMGSGIIGSFGSILVGLSFDLTASYLPAFYIGIAACPIVAGFLLLARLGARKLEWQDAEGNTVANGFDDKIKTGDA